MKAKSLRLGFVAFAALLGASTLGAQSLGDLARQQREKQGKEGKKATKVFTNENLPARPAEEGATAAAGIAAGSGAETTKAETSGAATEPGAAKPAAEATSETRPSEAQAETAKPEDKIKTRDYWQGRLGPARAHLASAQEEQQTVEDELQLLQIQQAREIAPEVQAEVAQKIPAKKAEIEVQTSATAKAQKAFDDIEKEFKGSGAPDEWSKAE